MRSAEFLVYEVPYSIINSCSSRLGISSHKCFDGMVCYGRSLLTLCACGAQALSVSVALYTTRKVKCRGKGKKAEQSLLCDIIWWVSRWVSPCPSSYSVNSWKISSSSLIMLVALYVVLVAIFCSTSPRIILWLGLKHRSSIKSSNNIRIILYINMIFWNVETIWFSLQSAHM